MSGWHLCHGLKQCVCLHTGARPDLLNNDNKTPYDLAKDPETAALLQHAGISNMFLQAFFDSTTNAK